MKTKRFRLDRFLSQKLQRNNKEIRLLLAAGSVVVDGIITNDPQQPIDEFSHIVREGEVLQARDRQYIMLYKPKGIISATVDAHQQTVLDLISLPNKSELHIAGRLDKNSTGLLLLSNDGRWSKSLSDASVKCKKIYQVTVRDEITDACIDAFANGIYFDYENITTAPAVLQRLTPRTAQVQLTEGRYHQIKRMFGRFRNPVLSIHRIAIGAITLDENLLPGQYRALTDKEVLLG
jgi:16S rRNA pseudouridine516 synthase